MGARTTKAVQRSARAIAALLVGVAALAGFAYAQQGHPLVGSWSGDWGTSASDRNRVLLLLEYDGEAITGVINPGRNAVTLTSATLDPATWTVRLEVAAAEQTGGVAYRIDGRIENLGSMTERTLVGTWIQGEQRGDFRLVMN